MELFADISEFQPDSQINWAAYVAAGRSRVSLRVGQGIGVADAAFPAHYANSKAAGVQRFIFYWFCYPWLHPGTAGAQAEAASFVGSLPALGPQDILMGDFEALQGNTGPASWYADFQDEVARLTGLPPGRIWTYSYLNYIQNNLQDTRLVKYPLILSWPTGDPNIRPACPGPWASYVALQYSTSSTGVPGMTSMSIDDNIYLGGPMLPNNWSDDGTALHNPNNSFVVIGANRLHILAAPYWSEGNIPLDNEVVQPDGSTQQYFRYSRLDYNTTSGTVEAWVGQALMNAATQPPPPPALTPAQQAWLDAGPPFKAALAGL